MPVSILDHLEKWKAEQRARTDIRENTKASYMVTSKWVLSRFPNDGTPGELNQELWTEVVEKYSASTANKILTILKALTSSMAAAGALQVDPYASLKQLDPPSAEVDPLSIHQIQEVIESIRSQGKRQSEEAADFVAVLAFSGIRVGQARALTPHDVRGDALRIRAGVTGAKKAKFRQLPMNRLLKPVIMRRVELGADPLFSIRDPRRALDSATDRLGFPHQRLHDLRHFFATYCIEQGVDIPTVSRWLGHKDGGVLAMRTYGHLRDEHSQAMARLI